MNFRIKSTLRFIGLFFLAAIVACDNKPTGSSSAGSPKTKWVNPRRNKIFEKVNIVERPLTAYEDHILGPVKSLRYKDYIFVQSEDGEVKTLNDSGYNVYDKLGRLVDQAVYGSDGVLQFKCKYKYNDSTNRMEMTYAPGGVEQSKTIFVFDKKGNRTESFMADRPLRKTVYVYDSSGNEIEEKHYSDTGTFAGRESYKYDQHGNQVEATDWSAEDKSTVRIAVKYDDKGNQTEVLYYENDTARPEKQTRKYDENGWCIETIFCRPNGATKSHVKLSFDAMGNDTAYIFTGADSVIDEQYSKFTEYEYDKQGNTTRETIHGLKNGKRVLKELTETTYEYY